MGCGGCPLSAHPPGPPGPEEQHGEVVPLGPDHARPPELPPPTPPGRLHGITVGGMAVCALAGILGMVAYVTVQWGDSAQYVVGFMVASFAGFLAFASGAVLTAARDTYARSERRDFEDG